MEAAPPDCYRGSLPNLSPIFCSTQDDSSSHSDVEAALPDCYQSTNDMVVNGDVCLLPICEAVEAPPLDFYTGSLPTLGPIVGSTQDDSLSLSDLEVDVRDDYPCDLELTIREFYQSMNVEAAIRSYYR